MTLGQRVRQLRRQQDITQEELAQKARLNFVTVHRIERNPHDDAIQFGSVRRIAIALGCSLDYLAGMDEEARGNT
jgi:transcriptional regulator with XRE-family HTH domain